MTSLVDDSPLRVGAADQRASQPGWDDQRIERRSLLAGQRTGPQVRRRLLSAAVRPTRPAGLYTWLYAGRPRRPHTKKQRRATIGQAGPPEAYAEPAAA